MAKICTNCGELKELDQFAKKNTAKDGRSSACKACRRKKYRTVKFCKKCSKEAEFNSKLNYCVDCKSSYDKERKASKKKSYKDFLSSLGCANCGLEHPDTLEVHHLFKGAKRFDKSRGQSSDYNVEDISLGTAIVLCANCHLIFHQHFGGRHASFPKQSKESTLGIIREAWRVAP